MPEAQKENNGGVQDRKKDKAKEKAAEKVAEADEDEGRWRKADIERRHWDDLRIGRVCRCAVVAAPEDRSYDFLN